MGRAELDAMREPSPFSLRGALISGLYHIEQIVGFGGYATVYLAQRVDTGAHVALKILNARHRRGTRALNRFLREATLLWRLEHPGIVTPLDAGMSDFGPYIAFELLVGASLRQHLRAGRRFSESETALVGIEILDALAAAHGAGVIHRDIKPENLFLCDGDGRVKVLDFGVAKALADHDGDATMLTIRGELTGTIAYAPPEQLGGDSYGPWSDLFALGLVMAEMMTGMRVFQGDDIVQHCLTRLAPEPVELPAEVMASAIGGIIERAVRKEEKERYQTAAAMRHELERCAAPRHSLVRATRAERKASGEGG